MPEKNTPKAESEPVHSGLAVEACADVVNRMLMLQEKKSRLRVLRMALIALDIDPEELR